MTDLEINSLAIQFVAEILNERDTKKDGYSWPIRWLCLRDDIKDKYLAEARKLVGEWWADELRAKLSRDEGISYFDAAPKEVTR